MKETKIYILIPVYNTEEYLDECLGSILSQEYSEYEVILVNDGSKDSSGEICDRYAAKHKHVHAIHKENGGQISARLSAISFIRQNCEYADTYSIFVDSDDQLKPSALAQINERIAESGCDLLIYGYEKFTPDGVYYTTLEEKTGEKLINYLGDLFREVIIEHPCNSLWRKAVKTEMLFFEIDERFKGIQMGEDHLHSLGIYSQNPRTLIVPDLLYRYRVNPKSVTQILKFKCFADELSSRYYTIEQIRKLNVWNTADFDQYLDKSLSVLRWDVRRILTDSPSRKDAIHNLKRLFRHPFVQEYCLGKISHQSGIWLLAFSLKHFKTLYFLHKLSIIKNSIKGE